MIDFFTSILGTILYPIFSIFFTIIDLIQDIFQAFAGTGSVTVSGTNIYATASDGLGSTTNGLVYYLLQSDLVRNLFLSILLLALILIVVFTFMAILKNLYAAQPKKWQEIIGLAIKGVGLFILVPACSLLGVWLGNVVLQAVDGATSGTSYNASISAKLFLASAYNANIIRSNATDVSPSKQEEIYNLATGGSIKISCKTYSETEYDSDYEYWAGIVDDCVTVGLINYYGGYYTNVAKYYKLWSINYLTLIVGGVFVLYALGAITFGMVKRMFILIILFIISPAVCAMYPIDEGNAYKSWVGEFKKNILSAYGAVAGMNLFLAIAPFIDQIDVGVPDTLGLIPLLLLIAGLYVVKDIISLISGFVGGANAYADGASLMTRVQGRMKQASAKTNKAIGSVAHGTHAAFVSGMARKEAGGSFFRGFAGSAVSSMAKTAIYGAEAAGRMGGLGLDVKGIKDHAGLSDKEREQIHGKQGLKQADRVNKKTTGTGWFARHMFEGQPSWVADEDGNITKHTEFNEHTGKYDIVDNPKHRIGKNKGKAKSKGHIADYDEITKFAEEAGVDVDKYLKKSGIANREDVKANREAQKSAEKAVSEAKIGTAQVNKISDTFFSNLANALGKGFTSGNLKERMMKGQDIKYDELVKPSGAGSKDKQAAQIDAIHQFNAKNAEIGMAEKMDAVRSSAADLTLKGAKIGIKKSDIDALSSAIKDSINGNTTSSLNNIDSLLTEIKKSSDKQEQGIAKAISDASKELLRELKKNTEETKPKPDKNKK